MNDLSIVSDFFIQNKLSFQYIRYQRNGPTDEYIITPHPTTNLKKIFALSQNLGLLCRSRHMPKVDHVYADGTIKISILKREIEYLSVKDSVLLSKANKDMAAPICLGTKSDGNPLIIDQSSVPNTIIGGSPGSGKSTLLHNMITNLLSNNVEISLVDPKSTEFHIYENSKGCERVIDDMTDFPDLLDFYLDKMKERYSLLKRYHCQSFQDFNKKFGKKEISPAVMIIDEWADLYLANKDVVGGITSLAQKGRAAGISIILATQRPSSQVLPGIIKASFSGRVALRCSSALESRIIMDSSGAEELSRGLAYYLDQNNLNPVLFSVPHSKDISQELIDLDIKNKKSNVLSIFSYVFG